MSGLSYLSETEKVRVVLHHGIFIHSVCYKGKEADLYALDNDWVEVLICPFSSTIVRIDTIGYQELDKYLRGSLPDLL